MTELEVFRKFERFWENYPRREDKKKARISFEKLSLEQQAKATEDCKTRYSEIEKRFIPLPTSYLNGERFEDDPIPVKKVIDWDELAEKHARPGESMAKFKRRWKT